MLTLLATANAQLISPVASLPVRLLIDSGSELTFIKEELITQLNLQRTRSSISIIGIGGNKTTHTRGVVSITLRSSYDSSTVSTQAHVLRTVTSSLPSVEAPHQEWPHLTGLRLADPDFLKPRPIDIIIGADSYGKIIKPNFKKGDSSMPIAQFSIFGWLVLGPVKTPQSQFSSSHTATVMQHSDKTIQDLLTKFWDSRRAPDRYALNAHTLKNKNVRITFGRHTLVILQEGTSYASLSSHLEIYWAIPTRQPMPV